MIYLGADHGGFYLKEKIKKWLVEWNFAYEDLGNKVYDPDDDYPRFALAVAQKVAGEEKKIKDKNLPWKEKPKGILLCRSAAGMVIAANRIKGVRAVAVFNVEMGKHSRLHNDANILALSGDHLEERTAQDILKVWLDTEFSNEVRHQRRIKMLDEL